jgi:hypothetical protein
MLADLADNLLFTTYFHPGLGLAGFYKGVIPRRRSAWDRKLITSIHLTLTPEHENLYDVQRRKET